MARLAAWVAAGEIEGRVVLQVGSEAEEEVGIDIDSRSRYSPRRRSKKHIRFQDPRHHIRRREHACTLANPDSRLEGSEEEKEATATLEVNQEKEADAVNSDRHSRRSPHPCCM